MYQSGSWKEGRKEGSLIGKVNNYNSLKSVKLWLWCFLCSKKVLQKHCTEYGFPQCNAHELTFHSLCEEWIIWTNLNNTIKSNACLLNMNLPWRVARIFVLVIFEWVEVRENVPVDLKPPAELLFRLFRVESVSRRFFRLSHLDRLLKH